MDTFFEQLVKIKKTGSDIAAYVAIWILAIMILTAVMMIFFNGLFAFILCGVFYGAFWLSSKLNVEYEYIITNGILDIDRITNKSSRTRVISIDLANVTQMEKCSPQKMKGYNRREVLIACNSDDQNIYYLVANKNTKGVAKMVFATNDKLQSAIEKFAPKHITNSLFK